MNSTEAIALLQTTIENIQNLENPSELDLALALTQTSVSLSKAVSSASPVVYIPQSENPYILAPLKSIMYDLGQKDPYAEKIKTFIEGAQGIKTEGDLINLALETVVDSNWSFKVDINSDCKEVSLINGNEVISLGKSLLAGNPLDAVTVITGLATKFEKEVFGFSVIEMTKNLDTLSKLLASPNAQDAKIEEILNTLDGFLDKMGVGRVSPYIKGVINLVNILNGEKAKANKIMEAALKEFEKGKQSLIDGTLPPVEEPTTTLPPQTTYPPEETYVVAPPDQPSESEIQGETQDENELISSSEDFEEYIFSEDEEDADYF